MPATTICPADVTHYDLAKQNFPIAHLRRGEEKKRIMRQVGCPVAWPPDAKTRTRIQNNEGLGNRFLMELACSIYALTQHVRQFLSQGWEVESLNIGVETADGKDYVKVGTWTLFDEGKLFDAAVLIPVAHPVIAGDEASFDAAKKKASENKDRPYCFVFVWPDSVKTPT
jgi:hypothetical protein